MDKKRVRYLFSGIVQGVGFRPLVYLLARNCGLTGFVQNSPEGVIAEVEGSFAAIEAFRTRLLGELPPLSSITRMETTEIEIRNDPAFKILPSSAQGPADVHITPDAATCPDCLQELFDPADRRYRYPFINCTHCGPRLTIISAIPYDRPHTSMACFPLCPQCLAEYENPADRRFHAEPNACPVCGPQLSLLDANGHPVKTSDPVNTAISLLSEGHILAIKGLGGFHLSVDAANGEAVKKLRLRKYREEKPLAVMVRDIDRAKQIAHVSPEEETLLASPQRPIVLLQKNGVGLLSQAVAPHVPNYGVMLPYTPLHHLLLENTFTALVMTSANQVDEPICTGNREALERLRGIADYFLVNNRDILVRSDDSIAFVAGSLPRLLRRSRGYVPQPLALKETYPPVLALGGQLKSTQCILKGSFAFISPHIGDMETPQARDFFGESLALMKNLTHSAPPIIACDLHPAYYASQVAPDLDGEMVLPIQHHHAHIVSCMAENKLSGSVIGLAMDGTGYGTDGHAWGGEFLIVSETEFHRFGHLQYLVLPGGVKAIMEPWRIAVSLLKSAYGPSWETIARRLAFVPDKIQLHLFNKIIDGRIHSPLTSGLGRLFDGVAALIGMRSQVSFEGQAAMDMEAAAAGLSAPPYPFEIAIEKDLPLIINLSSVIRAIVSDLVAGQSRAQIAASFHQTLIDIFAAVAGDIRESFRLNRVALSGGCFQNKILLEGTIDKLNRLGFDVYSHRLVPCNDGGLSLGQAVIAASLFQQGFAK